MAKYDFRCPRCGDEHTLEISMRDYANGVSVYCPRVDCSPGRMPAELLDHDPTSEELVAIAEGGTMTEMVRVYGGEAPAVHIDHA